MLFNIKLWYTTKFFLCFILANNKLYAKFLSQTCNANSHSTFAQKTKNCTVIQVLSAVDFLQCRLAHLSKAKLTLNGPQPPADQAVNMLIDSANLLHPRQTYNWHPNPIVVDWQLAHLGAS